MVSVKKRLRGRKYTIRIQESPEGGYTGQCLELPGAISEGETLEELKSNMTEAIQIVLDGLESLSKKDKKIVIEVPNGDIGIPDLSFVPTPERNIPYVHKFSQYLYSGDRTMAKLLNSGELKCVKSQSSLRIQGLCDGNEK